MLHDYAWYTMLSQSHGCLYLLLQKQMNVKLSLAVHLVDWPQRAVLTKLGGVVPSIPEGFSIDRANCPQDNMDLLGLCLRRNLVLIYRVKVTMTKSFSILHVIKADLGQMFL